MGAEIAERVQRLQAAVSTKHTQQLWVLIAASVEVGFVEHFQLKGAHADKMKKQKQV